MYYIKSLLLALSFKVVGDIPKLTDLLVGITKRTSCVKLRKVDSFISEQCRRCLDIREFTLVDSLKSAGNMIEVPVGNKQISNLRSHIYAK